jgi:hypothetical protein
MAGGYPMYSNRFTLYTPHVAQRIQNFMESKAVWSKTSSTGFRKYNKSTKQMEEFVNNDNDNRVPSKHRIPVTIIVGYYETDSSRDLPSYIYPALHGAYGFVFDSDGDATSDVGCKLIVETEKYPDTPHVFSLSSSTLSSSRMNKFHVNVATEDVPTKAAVYCDGFLLDERALDGPKGTLEYTVTGAPLSETNDPPTSSPSTSPSTSPSSSPSSSPVSKPICADDPFYRVDGKSNKSCNWVNKKKCKKMSDETKEKCPIACENEEKCTLPQCWADTDWEPKKKTDDFKDCTSIPNNNRLKKKPCATKGADKKTFAYQACAICGKCQV